MAASTVPVVRFVPIQEEHIGPILEIEQKANTAPWSERSFRNELESPRGVFRVVLANGAVAGYGGIWYVIDEAHVTNIAIREDLRGQGIGRRLIKELLDESKSAGMTCATLEVRKSNEPAIQLYRDLGFVEVAVRKGYYPDNREDAVVMWLYEL